MKLFNYGILLTFLSLSVFACQPGWVPNPGNGNGNGNGNGGLAPFHFVITPCQQSDSLGRDILPPLALDIIAENYPEDTITAVTGFRLPSNTLAYGVSLSGGEGLLFNSEGELVGVADNVVINLTAEDLPRPVINYLDREYEGWDTLNFTLTLEDSFGAGVIVFSLTDTEGEVLFSREGEFLCRQRGRRNGHNGNGNGNGDDDGDDDDDDDRNCERTYLQELVQPWLSANIGEYSFDDIQCDDWCDDEAVIEVELEDDATKYYFTSAGEFYFTEREYAADLPTMVQTTLDTDYPGYSLLDEEVEELTFADGTLAYELEIRTTDDTELELVIDAAGNVLCEDD